MKASALVALAAWLSVIGALWGVYLGHPLNWAFGVLVAACVIIGTVAGTLATRYATPEPKGPAQP